MVNKPKFEVVADKDHPFAIKTFCAMLDKVLKHKIAIESESPTKLTFTYRKTPSLVDAFVQLAIVCSQKTGVSFSWINREECIPPEEGLKIKANHALLGNQPWDGDETGAE